MDAVLCDELLQEVFHRLPAASSASASLVSRRWRSLLLSSLTTLTLHLPNSSPPSPLSSFTSLSSLTLIPLSPTPPYPTDTHELHSVLISAPHRLQHLRFLLGPLSPSTLISLTSLSFPLRNLLSLQLSSLRPLSFRWLIWFPLLIDLSVLDCSPDPSQIPTETDEVEFAEVERLQLESISLSGIRSGDFGFGWLWHRCSELRRLQLRSCEGTGDGGGAAFAGCLRKLRRLELRTCRTIADGVLRRAVDISPELEALVLYDGGSREGLRDFIARSTGALRVLDLRLPLDLDDTHLAAVAARRHSLQGLKLQSCCLLTGEGIRRLVQSPAVGGSLEELALVNCDVVEREMGLLTFVGQSLRRLKRLDLSYNEALKDRELGSMVAACGGRLVELRVRGCAGLSDWVMRVVVRWCEVVEDVDVRRCAGVSREGVEVLVRSCRRLRSIWVEDSKLTEVTKGVAWRRGIQLCC